MQLKNYYRQYVPVQSQKHWHPASP